MPTLTRPRARLTSARTREPARSENRPPLELPLTIDPRRLSQAGLLELMRLAAGLSLPALALRAGIGPERIGHILRGSCRDPRRQELARLRDLLWSLLPYRPNRTRAALLGPGPLYLSVNEVADLLGLRPCTVRQLAASKLGAINLGRFVRIPRAGLLAYLQRQSGLSPSPAQEFSPRDAAEALGVPWGNINRAIRQGRIRIRQAGPHQRRRIPSREIERIMSAGTHPLADVRPRKRRRKHELPLR